ncbi:hypothetical protein [Marinitoga sp. 38H-ov]|uniref:hypothetical protein n=1 Tax=Marinitoga sp. 38H-ov TaxID=1755814 RepID=UPI0013EC53A7|nr:hypothetical protein [Marinitoga sp. 38H-ov]KAF2955904.1 hypothetical protein AS160_08470 [Marinitoga sp. 38H-ov]
MKNILFETKNGDSIEILIGHNYYSKYINNKRYNNYIIYDKKIEIIDKLNLINSISVIGNENLKNLDKYLNFLIKFTENNINSALVFGGYTTLELLGYTLENINITDYSFFPSNLNSAIMPPLKGKYYLNFNWKKDLLTIKGYPKNVFIDTILFESISKTNFKNMFIVPYILGKIMNSKIAELSLNYSKFNFSVLDLEDYLYYSLKQWVYYLKNEGDIFPGETITLLFYNKKSGFNNNYLNVFGLSFLIELYISWYYGFLSFEEFEKIEKELTNNFDISYKLIEKIDLDLNDKDFILYTSSGKLIKYRIPKDDLLSVIKEVKDYFRGGFL